MDGAPDHSRRYDTSAAGQLIIRPALDRLRGDVGGQRVLAIGCGPTELAELRDAGAAERVGLDCSADALAAAATADPDAHTILADMDALDQVPLGVGRFDLIQMVMSLQYSKRPEAVLCAAFRALRPGGRAVVIVPHPVSWGDEREELDDAGHHRRLLGYQITAGPDGADTIRVFGSYHQERPVAWRSRGTEFILRKPCLVHRLLTDAGFTVPEWDEPEPPQDLSDDELAAVAERAGIRVATLRMFIERTSKLAHVAAFLAMRPSHSAASQAAGSGRSTERSSRRV